MKQYLDLMRIIKKQGISKKDRTGIGTLSIFGYQMRFNLTNGFPLVTTKFCNFRSIVYELLWFLNGDTNVNFLKKHNISIWNKWADNNGNLGPIYGRQWRSWKDSNGQNIDQITKVLHQLQTDKNSRRILVSSWNVGELEKMALVPCHVLFQFYVANKKLSCHLYQRSCDVFLGLPFNIASYSLLLHMLAQQCDLEVGDFIWSGGDVHLYNNHINQVNLQLSRSPRKLSQLKISKKPTSLFHYRFDDFELHEYDPYPKIPATIAV